MSFLQRSEDMLWQKSNTQFLSLSLVYLFSMESAKANF